MADAFTDSNPASSVGDDLERHGACIRSTQAATASDASVVENRHFDTFGAAWSSAESRSQVPFGYLTGGKLEGGFRSASSLRISFLAILDIHRE